MSKNSKLAPQDNSLALPDEVVKLFWDINLDTLELRVRARFVLEKIMEFGDFTAWRWTQKVDDVLK